VKQVYLVKYRGKIEEAEEFFDNPWIMDVPALAVDSCFDIILVDSPMGYQDFGMPGDPPTLLLFLRKLISLHFI
jgi:hypothetical protein